ncbi:MAG: DUF1161 domain-containing protein [Candidatus Electrothrix sp. AR3]|nr:DUF1161 domain-containing protein [Candidatus Electrothrix sp. AR3]
MADQDKVVGSCEQGTKKIEQTPTSSPNVLSQQLSQSTSPVTVKATTTSSAAIKSCQKLKAEIAAKLDAAALKSYSLLIVENNSKYMDKIVGSCEQGTKKIIQL